jgi:sec-independent protein translocase protein TatC
MPTDRDLFEEEKEMVAMSFGDHIEELRVRLILALLGLAVGVTITFIPPLNLGQLVMKTMQVPATMSLESFYNERDAERAKAADKAHQSEAFNVEVEGGSLAKALAEIMPGYQPPPDSETSRKKIPLKLTFTKSSLIGLVSGNARPASAMVALAPLEVFMIYFSVCLVTGLVLASPWVFYQIWAFVAAGLYRHERHYVKKFLPFSLGLFLGGVALCYFFVLPYTLAFLLQFNVWMGVEPTLRISEWMGFATIMPLIFGVCFQTPLVMLLVERLGVVSLEQLKEKRGYAIFIIVVVAAVITPTGDPITLSLLAVPMIALYELGLLLIRRPAKTNLPATLSGSGG